jgi:hypothetical protein
VFARAVAARHDHGYSGALNVIGQSNQRHLVTQWGCQNPGPVADLHSEPVQPIPDHALDQDRFELIRIFGASDRAASGTR